MSYNYNSLWSQMMARKKTQSNDSATHAVPIRQSKLSSAQLFFASSVISLFGATNAFAQQTTIIDPTKEGGFELGNTFTANGWTAANEGASQIKWAVGTAAS